MFQRRREVLDTSSSPWRSDADRHGGNGDRFGDLFVLCTGLGAAGLPHCSSPVPDSRGLGDGAKAPLSLP